MIAAWVQQPRNETRDDPDAHRPSTEGRRVMTPRWEVVAVHRSAYEGLDPACPQTPYESSARTRHRTWIGADWHRRFRARHLTMGMRWVETAIVPTSPPVPVVAPVTRDWLNALAVTAVDAEPRYTKHAERMWKPVYWLRNRWDGLRYGLDRDAR